MLNLLKQARRQLYFIAGIALVLMLSWISTVAPQAATALSANGLFLGAQPVEYAVAAADVMASDRSSMTVSRTHQEPNFYQ